MCSVHTGVAYGSTVADWGSKIREVFKEYVYNSMGNMKLSREVKIDESLGEK